MGASKPALKQPNTEIARVKAPRTNLPLPLSVRHLIRDKSSHAKALSTHLAVQKNMADSPVFPMTDEQRKAMLEEIWARPIFCRLLENINSTVSPAAEEIEVSLRCFV